MVSPVAARREIDLVDARISAADVRAERARLAEEACYRRFGRRPSTEEERRDDWYQCGYGVHQARLIVAALAGSHDRASPERGLILSDAMASELTASSAEECRALLAWYRWRSGGAKVNAGPEGARSDWDWACTTLRDALEGPPPARRSDAVRSWVAARYGSGLDRTIEAKAYCHSRGPHPRGRDGDHGGAGAYVKQLAPLAKRAVARDATATDHAALVRFLLDESSLEWEDAMELFLPRLVDLGDAAAAAARGDERELHGLLLGAKPGEEVEREHRWFASLRCLLRGLERPSSPAEMDADWRAAGIEPHSLAR